MEDIEPNDFGLLVNLLYTQSTVDRGENRPDTTMEMEDVEPNIFGLLVKCLYTQNRMDKDGSWQRIFDLARLWVLGRRCLILR